MDSLAYRKTSLLPLTAIITLPNEIVTQFKLMLKICDIKIKKYVYSNSPDGGELLKMKPNFLLITFYKF